MVLALIPDSAVDTFLNNMSEADFDQKYISVITKSPSNRSGLSSDQGPLQGDSMDGLLAKLKSFGLSDSDSEYFNKYIGDGYSLVAVDHYSASLVTPMLNDYQPKIIRTI